MPWRCFWQKRKPATSLHDCTDIEGVASILTDIGLEALAKTIQIAAKLDRDLSSAVVCDRLNSLAVESFTANKAAFCSPLDRAALAQELAAKAGFLRVQAQSSWRSADDTHKALCPSTDDQNQASRPVCRMPLPLIPPRSKDEVGTRRLAEAGNNSAEQLDRAAAALSVTDSALDNCSPYQTPRKLEPECTTQAVNATPYPKAISSSGATICGLMTSASANSSNASQQRNPGVSLGVEREKTSPSPALTSLHVSFSDSTFSVSHECTARCADDARTNSHLLREIDGLRREFENLHSHLRLSALNGIGLAALAAAPSPRASSVAGSENETLMPVTHEMLRPVAPACTAVPDSEDLAVAQKKPGEHARARRSKCRGDEGSVPLAEGAQTDEQVSQHHILHLAQRLPEEEDSYIMASASTLSTSLSSTSPSSPIPDSCRARRKEEEFVTSQDTAVVIEVPQHGAPCSSAKWPTGGFSFNISTVTPTPELLAPPTQIVLRSNAEPATSSAPPPKASPQLISAAAARAPTQAPVPAEICNKTCNPAHAHLKGATNPRPISPLVPGICMAGKREGDGKPPPSPKRRSSPRESLSPSTTPREPRSPSPTLREPPLPQIHKLASAARGTAVASPANEAQKSVVVEPVSRSSLQTKIYTKASQLEDREDFRSLQHQGTRSVCVTATEESESHTPPLTPESAFETGAACPWMKYKTKPAATQQQQQHDVGTRQQQQLKLLTPRDNSPLFLPPTFMAFSTWHDTASRVIDTPANISNLLESPPMSPVQISMQTPWFHAKSDGPRLDGLCDRLTGSRISLPAPATPSPLAPRTNNLLMTAALAVARGADTGGAREAVPSGSEFNAESLLYSYTPTSPRAAGSTQRPSPTIASPRILRVLPSSFLAPAPHSSLSLGLVEPPTSSRGPARAAQPLDKTSDAAAIPKLWSREVFDPRELTPLRKTRTQGKG